MLLLRVRVLLVCLDLFRSNIEVTLADLRLIGTASPSASRTATGTGGASSNTAGAEQPQDQEGAAATRSSSSTSFFALVGAFTALSIFM